jgi:hypothetical protein
VADLKARNVTWSRLDLRSVDRAGVVK